MGVRGTSKSPSLLELMSESVVLLPSLLSSENIEESWSSRYRERDGEHSGRLRRLVCLLLSFGLTKRLIQETILCSQRDCCCGGITAIGYIEVPPKKIYKGKFGNLINIDHGPVKKKKKQADRRSMMFTPESERDDLNSKEIPRCKENG